MSTSVRRLSQSEFGELAYHTLDFCLHRAWLFTVKIPLPGKGHSSPVVFGDAVFLVAALPVGVAQKPVFDDAPGVHDSVPVTHRHQFVALAINRRDGGILWMKSLREEWPHEGGHVTGSLASNSPVTDGKRLYVCQNRCSVLPWYTQESRREAAT